ncbi:hypothetical protein AOQ84DRAFT_390669 [Glonium stellatum]|uniref:RRM domain-containing protein n=1 Tax=Glonium stellatum TaxID=574774 RepID=A0A8E2JQG7_9PEZI|nr:hypothetical protein AOQ84DRAFT_390669 [Glonium stellatum]
MYSDRASTSSNWRARQESQPPSRDEVPMSYQSQSRDFTRSTNRKPHFKQNAASERQMADGRRIYVGNLPYMAKKSDVEALFKDAGYTINLIDMSIDSFTGRNPSYCFVELQNEQLAKQAMVDLVNKDILGRQIKLKPCIQKRQDRKTDQSITFDRWAKQAPEGVYLEQPFERDVAPDINPMPFLDPIREKRRLYVGGLPKPTNQHASDAEIRELFSGFEVVAVSKVISPHESIQSKPGNHFYAFVDFPSSEEADAAAKALNGKLAFGGRLKVNYSRSISRKVDERLNVEGNG